MLPFSVLRTLGPNLLLLLLPIVVIWAGLLIFALVDLLKPERRVTGGNKLVWALVIVLIGTIGPLLYLLAGRRDE
jgi:nitric oxide reductase large subunit